VGRKAELALHAAPLGDHAERPEQECRQAVWWPLTHGIAVEIQGQSATENELEAGRPQPFLLTAADIEPLRCARRIQIVAVAVVLNPIKSLEHRHA